MTEAGTGSTGPSARWLSVAALVCGVAACARGDSNEIVLEFWAMGREGEVVAELTRGFEASHPGIRVNVQQLPWQGAHEKLLTAFVGDATPDLAQMGNTWVPEFATLGALAALDPPVAASAVVEQADYFPGIWDTNVIDGRLFGVPWYVDTRLLFYRRDLLAQAGFDHPPRSWDEWREMLIAIKRLPGAEHYSILVPLNEFEPLLLLGLQQDEPLLREDGRWGNFRSPGFRRALGFYLELFEKELAPRATNTQISNVWNEFARGYFAFYITGPWNIGEFKRRLPQELAGSWMTAPLPGPRGAGLSNAGGSSLVVFANSRRQEAAWKLIEYLSQPEVQRRFYALSGDLPPRRSSWEGSALSGDVYSAAFREQLERVEPTPKVPEWERIATELRIVAEQAAHGALTVDAAVSELDARADRILEKRRWILSREAGP
ncbi:sugar ABC transporter substrate-binding protein [Hyalangium versicolor]|uniref:sugar ABC transporter substrate-binding protein n=1 Tax=Hyalangium versicolor TaxID=2861190 RepID=UPI001CC9ED56|nr:sugar ABC transporter substrate-binding protein [Hyalangium versicolor]